MLRLYRNSNDLGALSDRFPAALGPHRLQALVLWGERDPYVRVEFAETQRQFFDVTEVVRLSDRGHWPMIDNPTATRNAIIPFLRRQISGAG